MQRVFTYALYVMKTPIDPLRERLYGAYASQHAGCGDGEAAALIYRRDIRPVLLPTAGPVLDIGEAGAWVVPPADSRTLAAAIRTLAADPQRRQAMGQQGRYYVEKYFDRGMLARLYRKFLDSPGGRR